MVRTSKVRLWAGRRAAKWLLLAHLSGGCLFAASCGDQIRSALVAGVFDFIGLATNQLVSELLPTEDLIRDLLTANQSPFLRP